MDELEINLDYITGFEIIEIEKLAGVPFDKIGDPDTPKGRLLVAMATVQMRREDPDYTFEQAGNLRIKLAEGGDDPTGPGEQPG